MGGAGAFEATAAHMVLVMSIRSKASWLDGPSLSKPREEPQGLALRVAAVPKGMPRATRRMEPAGGARCATEDVSCSGCSDGHLRR